MPAWAGNQSGRTSAPLRGILETFEGGFTLRSMPVSMGIMGPLCGSQANQDRGEQEDVEVFASHDSGKGDSSRGDESGT